MPKKMKRRATRRTCDRARCPALDTGGAGQYAAIARDRRGSQVRNLHRPPIKSRIISCVSLATDSLTTERKTVRIRSRQWHRPRADSGSLSAGFCERLARLHPATVRLVKRHRPDIKRVARVLRARRLLKGQEISALLTEAA